MALRGHVFSKQLFSSECFALFIDIFLGKNSGVIEGCELLSTTNNITLEKGFFCIKGRFLEEEGHSIFEIEPVEQDTLFCKLICEIDLSQQNTTSELKQAYYRIIQSTSDYPALQQEDITAEGWIEDFQDKRAFLDFESFYNEIRRDAQYVFDGIIAQKDNFFAQLNITTKAEADALITDLQQYCDSVKEVLDGDVAINLLNRINTKADVPVYYTLTLLSTNWVQNGDKYEYTVEDSTITEDHLVSCNMSIENQNKLKDAEGDSYNGGFTIRTTELPEEDIVMDIVIQKMARRGGDADENEV